MYQQGNSDGSHQCLLSSIIDYSIDKTAIPLEGKYVMTKSGQSRLRKTTVGWTLLVQMRDGRKQWVPLRILK